MKKLLFAAMFALILLSVTACNQPQTSNNNSGSLLAKDNPTASKAGDTSNAVPPKRIALVMKTLTNPFFVDMEKGARKAETEFGINLIVKTGAKETSIEQQISIIEDMIQQKVDAIVIAPGNSTELIPVLKKAQEAGIPIVNIDNRIDKKAANQAGLVNVPFISVDNEEGAYLSAKYISDQVKKPAQAIILEGIREADNAKQRMSGAIRAFKENNNITIVASESANWKIDEANLLATSLFKKYPDAKVVFCANDMMALGVIEYLKKRGKKDVLIAGFDALTDVKQEIKLGNMQVSVNQQADVQGYMGVTYALNLIRGEKVPEETMVPVKLVTKNDLGNQ